MKALPMSSVSIQEATKQALQLFEQKAKFDAIADHLKKIGYVSERTRKPLGAQAVRYMIMKHKGDMDSGAPARKDAAIASAELTESLKSSNASERADKPIYVGGRLNDLMIAARTVIYDLDLDSTVKIGVLRALFREADAVKGEDA